MNPRSACAGVSELGKAVLVFRTLFGLAALTCTALQLQDFLPQRFGTQPSPCWKGLQTAKGKGGTVHLMPRYLAQCQPTAMPPKIKVLWTVQP
jgi:hypothetical protein